MSLPIFKLLIVEDFPADREQYCRALLTESQCIYDLLEAESVAAAIELCHTQQLDGILLDYALPDGDGLQFLETLARQCNGMMPPVVMMTGQGNESIAVRAMKLGAQDYLVKSKFTPELLRSTMRNVMENARLRQRLEQSNRRLRTSVETMLDCFGIYTAIRNAAGEIIDFGFDYLNPAALESNQMSAEDMNRGLCEVFPIHRQTGLFADYCQVVETGVPLVKEDVVYTDVFGEKKLTRAYDIHANKLDDGFVAAWRDVTAQKQTELQVQTANRRIVDIWENMTDAYVTVDRQWRLIYANRVATEVISHLTNLAPAEFLGRSYWDLFPSLVGGEVDREYRRALTDRVAVDLEIWFEPTGNWFESHLYPAPEGLGIYFRDITERKQIEMVRIEAERERDRFFNLSLDLLALGSFEGYFLRLNPSFEKLLGFTDAELMAQPFIDFVHPEDRDQTIASAGGLSEGDMVVNFENRYRCKDGSYRWISWSAMPHAPSNIWYAIGRNITERKQAEALIRESELKFSAVFDQTFELVGLLSIDGVVLEVNQTALASVSALQTEIVGQNFWDTPWWMHSPQLQHQLQDAIATAASGQLIRYEMQFPNSSGALMAIDFSLKPVFNESGRVMMLLAEGHDITERNQIRTALEARNLELDSFVYVVSHDLKAPLRAIANLSEWIEDDLEGVLTDDVQQQMYLLRSRVARMGSTIDGLLDYARLGKMAAQIELVSMSALLIEVIDSISPGAAFAIEIADNLPTLDANRLLLFQVFLNLVGNGIKHHDKSDGTIRVSVEDRGDCYEFAVADDGPGIAPEQHERVFRIFQAVNPQNRADSTGIGLAIVQKIIEAEGGTIWLESQLGKGTTFYFTWPKRV
jgi:PAS domain S-box-containing protein